MPLTLPFKDAVVVWDMSEGWWSLDASLTIVLRSINILINKKKSPRGAAAATAFSSVI